MKLSGFSFKKSTLILVISAVLVFSFGILIGYNLKYNAISNIQGFLFNSVTDAEDGSATDPNATDCNATDADATDPNATDCNATDADATDPNATDCNATDGNAQSTDNIIYLTSFHFKNSSMTTSQKNYVELTTTGADLVGLSVAFINDKGKTFTVNASLNDNNSFSVPNNIDDGTYYISGVLLTGSNSDGTTFTKYYSLNPKAGEDYFELLARIEIKKDVKQENLDITSLTLKNNKVNPLEKVYVSYKANLELTQLQLQFENGAEKLFIYVNSLGNNPYFVVPSNASSGTYKLVKVEAMTKNATASMKDKFDVALTVNEISKTDDKTVKKDYVYNNEDINSDRITELYNASKDATITINADKQTFINKELFNCVKGTNKKLIINNNDNKIEFVGSSIESPKMIDAKIETYKVSENSSISKLIKDGVVVDFANNGNLPGDAHVYIKATGDFTGLKNNVLLYLYNEDCDDFTLINSNVKLSSGYYEFDIAHNSKYVLVNEKLDDNLLADDTDDTVTFQKSTSVNILIIALCAVIIISVVVLILVVKKKDDKNKN